MLALLADMSQYSYLYMHGHITNVYIYLLFIPVEYIINQTVASYYITLDLPAVAMCSKNGHTDVCIGFYSVAS